MSDSEELMAGAHTDTIVTKHYCRRGRRREIIHSDLPKGSSCKIFTKDFLMTKLTPCSLVSSVGLPFQKKV